MRASFLCFLLILLVSHGASAQQGQTATASACLDAPQLIAFAGNAEFADACAAFSVCLADATWLACTPHFLADRLTRCATGDAVCDAQARLHTALIGLSHAGHDMSPAPSALLHDLATRLSDRHALERATIDEAIAWYLPVMAVYRVHPMLDYSIAVIHALKHEPTFAYEFYSSAQRLSLNDPLIYLSRAALRGVEGRETYPTADMLLAGQLTASISPPRPAEADAGAAFIEYPIIVHTDADSRATGAHLPESTRRAHLQPLDAHTLIFTSDHDYSTSLIPHSLILNTDTKTGGMSLDAADFYHDASFSIALWPRGDGTYQGARRYRHAGETQRDSFLLMPADRPESSFLRCPDAPFPLLSAGMTAVSVREGGIIRLHFMRGDTSYSEITVDSITIVEGPVCDRGGTWYRILGGGVAGWVRENETATTYAIIAP